MSFNLLFCTHSFHVLLLVYEVYCDTMLYLLLMSDLTNNKNLFLLLPFALGGIPKEGFHQSTHTALLHELHSFILIIQGYFLT